MLRRLQFNRGEEGLSNKEFGGGKEFKRVSIRILFLINDRVATSWKNQEKSGNFVRVLEILKNNRKSQGIKFY